MAPFQVAALILLIGTVLIAQVQLEVVERDVSSFITREKCFGDLGCFNAGSPFFDILERPLSLVPDEREVINTHFCLFTPSYPTVPFNFSNLDRSINYLPRSGFNPSYNISFIIPGYISRTAPYWKMPLKDAILRTGPRNVFYVDWSGGDGALYEQAVANTRIVGAEIARFIKHLQEKVGINPESIHLIGHSLGSHIAGYAGKRIPNLGRITAMDPAGPYFTNVDPIVRLDRGDALFVDAIHTNAAPSRFTGFGLTESIAHFDFFPNGGHLQPGCQDMGEAILGFLAHPTFDAEGLKDIMCNHARAIKLFMSSITHQECKLMGKPCPSLEQFNNGECGSCLNGEADCVQLGIQSKYFADRIDRHRSLNFYLNTTDKEPFCME